MSLLPLAAAAMNQLMELGMAPPTAAVSRLRVYLLHGVLLYSALVALTCRALDETSIRLALRLQGRLSFALFWLALSGPALARLRPRPLGNWLARQRPTLLVAFAVSHLCHGLWVVLFFWLTPHDFVFNLFDGSGILTFPLLVVLLVLARHDVRLRLGPRAAWLERGVVVYAWLQFFGFFIDRLQTSRPDSKAWYALATALSVAAGLLGLWDHAQARSGRGGAPLVRP